MSLQSRMFGRMMYRKRKRLEAAERCVSQCDPTLFESSGKSDGPWRVPARRDPDPLGRDALLDVVRVSLENNVKPKNRTMIEPILRLVEKALEAEGDDE